ncbi:MAG: plasmid pRiA4b ORF-3 family protein [Mesorhizobium sp.]|nr:MAG: plasmid pRiA4b ORF-3 family protein [Mesorhizobium sp.]TIN90237.1 MAG: plasmid pRiA4b ORF-3 family protein [Mesorhizobium sp.]
MLDPFAPDSYIVRAEAHIVGIEARISRTLELPMALNLAQLQELLQASLGWTDSRLHQCNIGGIIYGAPGFDDDGFTANRIFEATELRMLDFVFSYDPDEQPITILYEYDFGDNWRHLLSVWNAFRARQASIILAALQLAVRAARGGGPHGYAEFLEAWRDSGHEEHKAMRRWAGRKFHSENRDLDAINVGDRQGSARRTRKLPLPPPTQARVVPTRQKPFQAQTGQQNVRRHGKRIVTTVQCQNSWPGSGVLKPLHEPRRERRQHHFVSLGQHDVEIEIRPCQTMCVILQVKWVPGPSEIGQLNHRFKAIAYRSCRAARPDHVR